MRLEIIVKIEMTLKMMNAYLVESMKMNGENILSWAIVNDYIGAMQRSGEQLKNTIDTDAIYEDVDGIRTQARLI